MYFIRHIYCAYAYLLIVNGVSCEFDYRVSYMQWFILSGVIGRTRWVYHGIVCMCGGVLQGSSVLHGEENAPDIKVTIHCSATRYSPTLNSVTMQ